MNLYEELEQAILLARYRTRDNLTAEELAKQPAVCEWCGRNETRGDDLYPQTGTHLGRKWCCEACVETFHDCEAAIEADNT